MGFKAKMLIIISVLIFPCWFLLVYNVTKPGGIFAISGLEGGKHILLVFGVSFVLSIVVTLCTTFLSAKANNQLNIENEVQKNGYTDKYYELLKGEIERLSAKSDTTDNIYTDYILKLSNYYMIKHLPEEALNTVNVLNLYILKENAKKNDAGKMKLLNYYNIQLCICDDLDDLNRAYNIMEDAKAFINIMSNSKSVMIQLSVDEFCSTFYAMCGDYGLAEQYADKMEFLSVSGKTVANIQYSKIRTHQGDFEGAHAFLDNAEESKGKNKMLQDMIQSMREEVEIRRCRYQTN